MSFNMTTSPDGRLVKLVAERNGQPPTPTIVQENPAYAKWVERAALILCDEAGELGEIPTPCFTHIHEASRISAALRMTVMNSAGR